MGVWLAARSTPRRWLAVGVAVLFLIPNFGSGRWDAEAPTPSFFTEGTSERELAEHDRVFIWPNFGAGSRWHAETGMAFIHVGGYVGRVPPDYEQLFARVPELAAEGTPEAADELRRFLEDKRATAIVLDERQPPIYADLFRAVAGEPQRSGGVLLYRLDAGLDAAALR